MKIKGGVELKKKSKGQEDEERAAEEEGKRRGQMLTDRGFHHPAM